jgi:hypothetical protein
MTRTRATALTLCMFGATLFGASPAIAQLGTTPPEGDTGSAFISGKAPTPKKADADPRVLWAYLCVIVILGSIIGANLIPSKRGHQD